MNCGTQASASGTQGGYDLMRCCWMPSSHPASFSIQKIKSTAYLVRCCLFPVNVVHDDQTLGPMQLPPRSHFALRMTNLDLEVRAMTDTHVNEIYSNR